MKGERLKRIILRRIIGQFMGKEPIGPAELKSVARAIVRDRISGSIRLSDVLWDAAREIERLRFKIVENENLMWLLTVENEGNADASGDNTSETKDAPVESNARSVGRYQKVPVIVDAIQYQGDNAEECMKFLGKHGSIIRTGKNMVPVIETRDGVLTVNVDDWIIRGVEGEFYPCKPIIFELVYKKVSD